MIKKGLPYIFQVIILGIGLIMMTRIELYQNIIGYICIFGGLSYFIIYFIKTNYRPKFLINNPDHFPTLNENALKDHISLIVNNQSYPLNGLIEKITLYKGVEEKYVLVVKIGINEEHFASHLYAHERKHPYFLEFMNHWQPDSLRFLAHKNFGTEVYRSGYSSDSCLLDDWLICVQSLNEELPDDEIIIKKYNWLLFKKNWYARIKQRIEHITNHWS